MELEESERRLVMRTGVLTSGGDAPGMNAAVEALANGEIGVIVGIRGPRIERVPLAEVVGKEQLLDSDLYRMAEALA
jgi:6-phosphofructokinase